jgi:hypothetical protein
MWKEFKSIGPAFMSLAQDEFGAASQVLEARWNSLDEWIKGVYISRQVHRYSATAEIGESSFEAKGEEIKSQPRLQ